MSPRGIKFVIQPANKISENAAEVNWNMFIFHDTERYVQGHIYFYY